MFCYVCKFHLVMSFRKYYGKGLNGFFSGSNQSLSVRHVVSACRRPLVGCLDVLGCQVTIRARAAGAGRQRGCARQAVLTQLWEPEACAETMSERACIPALAHWGCDFDE